MALPPLVEPATELTKDEIRRYSRHLIIPDVGMDGQQRLKNARVLAVGAGGLGSPTLLYLAAAGVGTLGIVDFDVVDETNLQRQIIHGQADVGRSKAQSAKESIAQVNPYVEVILHEERLDSSNALGIVSQYDVIVDGTDNLATRYLVNDGCVLSGKPYVWGSIYRFGGQWSVFWAEHGPCCRCCYPVTPAPRMVRARKNPECPLCGKNPTITELIDYEAFCGVVSHEAEEAAASSSLTARELKAMLDDGDPMLLVDVREPGEFEIVRIPGAV